jgi:hypothetical protein
MSPSSKQLEPTSALSSLLSWKRCLDRILDEFHTDEIAAGQPICATDAIRDDVFVFQGRHVPLRPAPHITTSCESIKARLRNGAYVPIACDVG